jgi:thiamine monophosphate synthase
MIITDEGAIEAVSRLPRGSGILLLKPPRARDMRRLRGLARRRHIAIIVERPRTAVRVHNSRELLRAMQARTPLILLSPLFPTSSHPDRKPIPRMRAAALARLGRRCIVALGGMDQERFATLAPLGFADWAGISAWKVKGRPVRRLSGAARAQLRT